MQSGNIEGFKQLSQFRDTKDFNNHIEQWMTEIKKQFTKSELVALKRLIRFSAKIVGVCNAKIGTVVSATYKRDGAGISRSTFKRMATKAKELGLLHIHETQRKNGSQSANVYVFNRFELPKEENLNRPKANSLSKTNNQINNNIRKEKKSFTEYHEKELNKTKEQSLDHTYTAKYVPNEFVQVVTPYFNCALTIEDLWKSVFLDTRQLNLDKKIITGTAIDAFKQSIRSYKKGKIKTTLVKYFTGTVKKMIDKTVVADIRGYEKSEKFSSLFLQSSSLFNTFCNILTE
ncbi:hypothetical protein [Priestia megaterium]|uniref:hypothetical protein n=1 Tax=Priestia megaterium TaxID=1404 RepID=UPI0015AD49C7|nr:hypothetical protein [Priestia megaterium]QLC85407.1 hypothetical protein HW576_02255 [Priestia megaterium]